MQTENKKDFDAIRRAISKLEFETWEMKPDFQVISAQLTIAANALERIGNRLEGTL